jgi:pimeloyl-ACP methyl ester carboxylesterase
MINDLILKDTTRDEWEGIRARIKNRIEENLGSSPASLSPSQARFEELDRYESYGFIHIKIKYHVFGDEWAYAVIILPKDIEAQGQARAVVVNHGTNGVSGKYGNMRPDIYPRREYALELAERGFVTISPDQFGFGEAMEDEAEKKKIDSFYEDYPEWSLTGRRVLGHIRAIDVLDSLDYVIHERYGVMGNSLGGQAALYLAGMDERIKAAVVSTGISPFATNAYRLTHTQNPLHPHEARMLEENGRSPWELNEMIGLCAPRAMMFIEPFNDPYNPYTSVAIDCVKSAHKVYALLGTPERLSLHLHGDGHDTVTEVRNMGYDWLERYLK